METKDQIIDVANNLLIERGFNAFSYKNISEEIAIKTSSIHYHFPTKSDLGIAVIRKHCEALEQTILKSENKTALEKAGKLFRYYQKLMAEEKVCIVSAFSSDINTLDENLRQELLLFGNTVFNWIVRILEEGQQQKKFKPIPNTKLKAKLIMASLMGIIQTVRIEKNKKHVEQLAQLILDDLIQ